MCTSFKAELLLGVHDFRNTSGDTFKIALYTSSASLGADTTAFTTSNEVSGTNYSSGGNDLDKIVKCSLIVGLIPTFSLEGYRTRLQLSERPP